MLGKSRGRPDGAAAWLGWARQGRAGQGDGGGKEGAGKENL